MNRRRSRDVFIGIVVVIVATALFLSNRPTISKFVVWENFRWDELALTLDPANAELAMRVGEYYMSENAHDLTKARNAFNSALSIDESVENAHFGLARIHFIQGNNNSALLEINNEIKKHPEHIRAYYMRGLIYGYRNYTNDFENAERDFKYFVEKNPGNWAGYNDLAWMQLKSEKFQEAKDTILLAFERLPNEKEKNAWLFTNLGVAELSMGNYNEAMKAFWKAQEISKKYTAQYFWSAYPGNDPRNKEESFKQFRAVLHFNLGLAHLKSKELQEAMKEFKSYLAILPEGPYPPQREVTQKINEMAKEIE